MEFAKKYALVPQEHLTKHVITQSHISDLDREMLKILNSKLEAREKITRYHDLLQKKLNMEEYNTPLETIKDESEFIHEETAAKKMKHLESSHYEDIILNSIPTKMQKKAQTTLSILKREPTMLKWNEKGEVFYRGEKINHSNIADLFSIIFSNKKKVDIPAKDEFLSVLNELNIPKQYIQNKNLTAIKREEEEDPDMIHTVNKSEKISKRKRPVHSKKGAFVKRWESLK